MAKRHSDALVIINGACNPSGIAHALVRACQEIRAEPTYSGTDEMRRDPALRLMVHQLSFLMGNGEMPMGAWDECVTACRSIVENVPRALHCNWCGKPHPQPAQSALEALARCCKVPT